MQLSRLVEKGSLQWATILSTGHKIFFGGGYQSIYMCRRVFRHTHYACKWYVYTFQWMATTKFKFIFHSTDLSYGFLWNNLNILLSIWYNRTFVYLIIITLNWKSLILHWNKHPANQQFRMIHNISFHIFVLFVSHPPWGRNHDWLTLKIGSTVIDGIIQHKSLSGVFFFIIKFFNLAIEDKKVVWICSCDGFVNWIDSRWRSDGKRGRERDVATFTFIEILLSFSVDFFPRK